MNATFIVDCSVAMTWLFQEEETEATAGLLERLVDEVALVPGLWFLEVGNVLAVAERKGRIAPNQSDEFIALLSQLDFEVDFDSYGRAFDSLLPLSREHKLTAYDAVYLDLALRRRLPLATLDEPLRFAAQKLQLAVLGK